MGCASLAKENWVPRLMTDEQRYTNLISLGRRVRDRILAIVEEIDSQPDGENDRERALVTWRVVLLLLTRDISDSVLTLAETRTRQTRAMTILNRSLFEYVIRLEFYAYDSVQAEQHWRNAEVWLRDIATVIDAKDLANMSKAEIKAYNRMISIEGDFDYPRFRYMLRMVFKHRGLAPRERKRGLRWAAKYYAICSALVHGGQGAFYDALELQLPPAKAKLALRSARFSEFTTLGETVHFMIQSITRKVSIED